MAIKPQTADRENLAAELHKRNYPDESIGKILGGNMMRVLRTVLRKFQELPLSNGTTSEEGRRKLLVDNTEPSFTG